MSIHAVGRRPGRGWLASAGAACMLIAGAGCGKGDGLEGLVPVAGKVIFKRSPLTTGQVIFRPDAEQDNYSKHEPRGAIDPQGNYTLTTAGKKGAAPGWYRVAVIAEEPLDTAKPYVLPKSLIPVPYTDPTTSKLKVHVVEKPAPGAYDLELVP